jgi:hypothetical protein
MNQLNNISIIGTIQEYDESQNIFTLDTEQTGIFTVKPAYPTQFKSMKEILIPGTTVAIDAIINSEREVKNNKPLWFYTLKLTRLTTI